MKKYQKVIIGIIIIIIILLLFLKGCKKEIQDIKFTMEKNKIRSNDISFKDGIEGIDLSIFSGDIELDFECFDECIMIATGFGGCYDICDAAYCDFDSDSDDCIECEEACDMEVWTCIFDECIIPGDAETYIWNGRPVDNYGTFFEEAYPIFYEQFSFYCESPFWEGTWVADEDTMGCVDADMFWYEDCIFLAISSAASVCETIGGTWTCEGDCSMAFGDCDESNAILTCTR